VRCRRVNPTSLRRLVGATKNSDLISDALGDLLDGFVLTVLIAVAIGTIYYCIRLVKELRRSMRR
jgi:hypothetical protein